MLLFCVSVGLVEHTGERSSRFPSAEAEPGGNEWELVGISASGNRNCAEADDSNSSQ